VQLIILGNNGPYPAPGGACSGYLVERDGEFLALDLGSGSLARLYEYTDPARLCGVVLSHLHFDHMSDLLPMSYALAQSNREMPLPVIAPTSPEPVRALLELSVYELREPGDTRVGPFELSFQPGRHPVPSYAVSVSAGGSRLVYTGDTNTCDAIAWFAEGAELLLADAGFTDADWAERKPHLSASLCGEMARDGGVKRLLLTHIHPRANRAVLLREAQSRFPGAKFAEPGAWHSL